MLTSIAVTSSIIITLALIAVGLTSLFDWWKSLDGLRGVDLAAPRLRPPAAAVRVIYLGFSALLHLGLAALPLLFVAKDGWSVLSFNLVLAQSLLAAFGYVLLMVIALFERLDPAALPERSFVEHLRTIVRPATPLLRRLRCIVLLPRFIAFAGARPRPAGPDNTHRGG